MQSNCNMIFTSCTTFGRGNSEPDMVRSKARPQGETERQRVVLLFCSQGIQALCTLGKCWAVETGFACRMKRLMQFTSYCHTLYFLSSITYYNCTLSDINLHTGKLTLTHFIPAQNEKNVTVNSFFANAPQCVCMTCQYEQTALDQGPQKGSVLFCVSVCCCCCQWRVNLDHPRAVTVWW